MRNSFTVCLRKQYSGTFRDNVTVDCIIKQIQPQNLVNKSQLSNFHEGQAPFIDPGNSPYKSFLSRRQKMVYSEPRIVKSPTD